MIARLAFRIWGQEFHRLYAANEMRGTGREGLSFAFHGPDGYGYETWKDLADLPAARLKRIEELMIWVDAKTTKASIRKVVDDVTAHLPKVIAEKSEAKRSQEAAKIPALLQEMLLRSENIIPQELYYQIAATCVVRENEDPRTIDEVTHEAKAAMLRGAGRAGADFFTRVSILRQLLGLWLTSAEGLAELLISWMMDEERKEAARKALGYGNGSKSTEHSSTSSPFVSHATTSKATTA